MNAVETAKDILAQCLFIPADKISDDANIFDLKPIDSVTFETLVLEIENRIGREADIEALMGMRTVRDLAALVATSAGSPALPDADTGRGA